MLIFKCRLPHNELAALQKYLPGDEFCIINHPEQKIYYGVMKEAMHSKFMDILSGETLEHLEYLDEKDLREAVGVEHGEVIGNHDLLKNFLAS